RLAGAILFPNGHKPRHLRLGDAHFLAAPLGQRDVFDLVIRYRCRHVLAPTDVISSKILFPKKIAENWLCSEITGLALSDVARRGCVPCLQVSTDPARRVAASLPAGRYN